MSLSRSTNDTLTEAASNILLYPNQIDSNEETKVLVTYYISRAFTACSKFIEDYVLFELGIECNKTQIIERVISKIYQLNEQNGVIINANVVKKNIKNAHFIVLYDQQGNKSNEFHIDACPLSFKDDERLKHERQTKCLITLHHKRMLDKLTDVYGVDTNANTISHLLITYCSIIQEITEHGLTPFKDLRLYQSKITQPG